MMLVARPRRGDPLLSALWRLWNDRDVSRRLVVPLFIGFGILGSVAGQEYVGDIIEWDSAMARGIRAMLEEGTELFGMLFLLATILPLGFGRDDKGGTSFLRISDGGLRKLLLVAALYIPVFAVLPEATGMDHKGQVANWLAAACLTLAALMSLRVVAKEEARRPIVYWILAALCLFGSAAAMSIAPGAGIGLGTGQVSLRLLVVGLTAVAICALWLAASMRPGSEEGLVAAAVAVWALIAPAMVSGDTGVYLLTQCLAVAVAAGTLFCVARRTVREKPPAISRRAV